MKYQGKGVFVRTPKISSSLTTFKGFTYFCQENHIKTYTKILENKVVSANAVMAKKLELKDGEKLVYLKRLRHVNDRPVNQYNNRGRDCFNGTFRIRCGICINRNGLFEYGKSATYYKTGTFGGLF